MKFYLLDVHSEVINNGLNDHLIHSSGPCIPSANVSACWIENMGLDFDWNKDKITSSKQCESARNFERCLKKYLFEDVNSCTLEEKETTVDILLSTIKWNLTSNTVSSICYELRHHWNIKQIMGIKYTKIYNDIWDRSKRFAFDLRTDFGSMLDLNCNYIVRKFDKPCEKRFEKRLRYIWSNEDNGEIIANTKFESEAICW